MQMLKKSVALVLSVLMLLSMFSVAMGMTAFAADGYKVTVQSTQGIFADTNKTYKAGDTFDVTYRISAKVPLVQGEFGILFDADALVATKLVFNSKIDGLKQSGDVNNAVNQKKNGGVFPNFAASSPADYVTEDILMTVTFAVQDAINKDQIVKFKITELWANTVIDNDSWDTDIPYVTGGVLDPAYAGDVKGSVALSDAPEQPTEAPTTEAPTTEEPTTEAPTTEAPTTEAPTTEAPTTAPNTYTTKFTNNKGWSKVYLYAWDGVGGENAQWPGVELTDKAVNGFGEEQYTVTFDSKYNNIIFNDGSEQTVDIAFDSSVTGYYLLDEKDSKGHYLVDTWTEEPETQEPTTEEPTTEEPTTEEPTTEAPTTEAPTTEAPTTEAPTTEPPEETTEAPTTEAPTTEAPTTAAPEGTTAAPEETTEAPEGTTAAPEETTAAPEETTEAPEETTAAPEVTTAALDYTFLYLPSTAQEDAGNTYKLSYTNLGESANISYTFTKTPITIDGVNLYSVSVPKDDTAVKELKYEVYNGDEWLSQVSFKDVNLEAFDNMVVKADGTIDEKPTEEVTTAAPEETTEASEETTAAPEETTEAPEETTVAPEETTEAPEGTTAAPEETTDAPEETTAAPENTTAAPENTTAAPENTTAAPENTTAAPTNAPDKKDTSSKTNNKSKSKTTDKTKATQAPTVAPSKVNFSKKPDVKSAVNAVSKAKSDKDPKGSKFSKLKAKVAKTTKKSNKITWSKVKGAKKYIVMGNKCGKTKGKFNKFKKLKTTKGKSFTHSKLKKNTYYKYVVLAVNGKGKVITSSKVMHVATKGGKNTNYKKITLNKKSKTLKKGKTFKLKIKKKIKMNKKGKVKNHIKTRYESANTKIATVNSKGKIKAKKKGTTYVYAYAQNGVYARIKIKVK